MSEPRTADDFLHLRADVEALRRQNKDPAKDERLRALSLSCLLVATNMRDEQLRADFRRCRDDLMRT